MIAAMTELASTAFQQGVNQPLAAPTVCAATLPLSDFLTFKLVALANTLQTQVTRHYIAPATPVGLAEWRLMGLMHQHGEMHAGALARISLIDKAQISRCLQPLIDRGWILRRIDPEHARRHLLSLSGVGQAVFGQVLALARPYQAALWNALSVPERESLAAIMDKLAAAAGQLDEQAMREGAAVKGRRLGLGRKMRGAAGQDA